MGANSGISQKIYLRAEQQAFVKAFLLDEDLESEISMDELIDFLSYLFLYWAIVLIYEVCMKWGIL